MMADRDFAALVAFSGPAAEAVHKSLRTLGLTDPQIVQVATFAALKISLDAHGTDVVERVRDAVDQWEESVIFKRGK